MATYLADRVIVFQGTPAIAATATPYVYPPVAALSWINLEH
jgi:translation initiation factor RLI1